MRGWVLGAASMAVVIALSGCQRFSPKPTPTPTASASAVAIFRSQDAAAAEAEATYRKYAAASDSVAADGGVALDRISRYVTAAELKDEEAGARYLREHSLRITGTATLVTFQIRSANLVTGEITAYACTDVSKSRVINKSGSDVTPPNRKDRQTSLARFVWQGDRLLLDKTSPWSGSPLC